MKAVFNPKVLFLCNNKTSSVVQAVKDHSPVTIIKSKLETEELLQESKNQILLFDIQSGLENTINVVNKLKKTNDGLELIFVSENPDITEITSLLNQCEVNAVITSQCSSGDMKEIINNSVQRCKEKNEQDQYITGIERTNEQLEFHLRERLIS